MRTTSRTWRVAAAALVLAVLLAACGGSSSSSPTSSAQAAAPSSSSSSSSSSAAPASTAVAKPGASFGVGQAATVNFIPPSQNTKTPVTRLQVTVQSIQKGTLADFKNVQLDAQQKAGTPTYVQVKIANIGSKPAQSDTAAADIEGVDNTGNTEQSLTIIGDFARCNDASSEKPISPGKSLQTCLIFLVPGGISKVAYTGTEDYIGSPVTWK
jgi:hypothetical protein